MSQTNFWLIRHALVEENARAYNYGATDVELCPHTLESAPGSIASRESGPAQVIGCSPIMEPRFRTYSIPTIIGSRVMQ